MESSTSLMTPSTGLSGQSLIFEDQNMKKYQDYIHTGKCIRRFGGSLGIDSSTDLDDWYSNLFLNAYINRHVHAEYLMI